MPRPAPIPIPIPISPVEIDAERVWLERLRRRYHTPRRLATDPLVVLSDYDGIRDREIAGLVAASLAYGNVKAMLPAIRSVLRILGPRPAARLASIREHTIATRLDGYRYRFTTGTQVASLLVALKRVLREHGSLEACFAAHDNADDVTTLPALGGFIDELLAAATCPLLHLLPHPARGSACKRLHLYLRWMVRADAIDPGGWRTPHPRRLLMPVDTHVHRTALERGWTTRRAADAKTTLEITAVLRAICPDDPLRYDFAITRPGIIREPAA